MRAAVKFLKVPFVVVALCFASVGSAADEADDLTTEGDSLERVCYSQADCLAHERCVIGGDGTGVCQEIPQVGQCRTDADCDYPMVCVGFRCRR